jgi:RNA polymerase sigma factor (sigma-70 family)
MQAQDTVLRRPHEEWVEDTFRSLAPRLWRVLLLYSGSAEIASDAVSEAFAQAMANRQDIRDPNAWIWSAAFRIAGGEVARRVHLVEPPDVPMAEGVDRASLVDLIRALAQLSDLQRRALILRHYLGYSNVEVAQILGSSPSAIGVHLFRSSRKLRALLSEEVEP